MILNYEERYDAPLFNFQCIHMSTKRVCKNINHYCCAHRIRDIPVPKADSIVISREFDDIPFSFSDRSYRSDVGFSLHVNYAVLIIGGGSRVIHIF